MRLLLIGRREGVTHWLEDATGAWRADGHEVVVAHVRDPRIPAPIERALFSAPLGAPRAAFLAGAARRVDPDLIVVIGAFHCPISVLERLRAWRQRPAIVGWVGDRFDQMAAETARYYDVIGYTDTAFLADHRRLEASSAALYLPHAVDPASAPETKPDAERAGAAVFVGNPTPQRLAVLGSLEHAVALHGPGWPSLAPHAVHRHRIAAHEAMRLYSSHRAALNIRNELHVAGGLNQRNFAPCLAGAASVADAQGDLDLCFEPGREVISWRGAAELDEILARLAADPAPFAEVARRGRARVLADHTFARRLERIRRAL